MAVTRPDEPPPGLIASVRAVGREPEAVHAGQRWGFGAFLLVEAVFVLSAVFITAVARTSGTDIGSSVSFVLIGSIVPTVLAAAIAMFLFVWLIGPICEEIIYRGLLWGALERLKWGRWAVFMLTTVIFAVSHLEPLRTSLLLVIGIPIGLARLYTGRLGASIITHQVNNFLPALAVLLMAFGAMPA